MPHHIPNLLLSLAALVAIAALTGACTGDIMDAADPGADATMAGVDPDNPDTDPNVGPEPEPEPEPITAGFDITREQVQLLPFVVRMSKLTAVVGLPETNPVFDGFWARRYDLGDHNYADGIGADLNWSAGQMAVWAEALRPVCTDPAFVSVYPDLSDAIALSALMEAAWGRVPHPDEVAGVELAISESGVAPELHHEVLCLGVLSSLEFVGQ